jgi:hypothetical protein
MRSTGAAAALLVLLTAACGGSAPRAPAPLGAMPIEARLLYDNGGGVRDSSAVVIRDAAALNEAWQRATSTQGTPPPVPDVDFRRDMVLLVSTGRMWPDDQLRVDSAGVRRETTTDGRQEEVLAVTYTVTEGCRRINRDAYPVELVRIRRYDGPVRFIGRRERATNCR